MPANFHLDLVAFAQDHLPEITGTVGLVSYALLRNKLTPAGIFAGILVAGIHTLHPWRAFFWLLIVFFLVGTLVTRVRPCSCLIGVLILSKDGFSIARSSLTRGLYRSRSATRQKFISRNPLPVARAVKVLVVPPRFSPTLVPHAS
jgi:MFS family permease